MARVAGAGETRTISHPLRMRQAMRADVSRRRDPLLRSHSQHPVPWRAKFPYLGRMDEPPLRAGERLVPPEPRPNKAEPEPPPAKKRRRRKRTHWSFAALRGLMGALVGLVLAAGVAGVAGAWMVYQHFAAGLPDVDGLRGYQPPVMS